MKHRILLAEQLAADVFRLTIEARDVARGRDPRQDFVLGVNERGERIPLAIADADADKGTIVVVFQVAGPATEWLATLRQGDEIPNLRIDQRSAPGRGKRTMLLVIAAVLLMLVLGGAAAFFALRPMTNHAESLSAAAGDPAIVVAGEPGGRLQLTTHPAGALAFVDGELRCNATPCKIRDVTSGPHEIRLEKAGYKPQTRRLEVAGPGKATKLSLTLEAAGAPVAANPPPALRGPVGYLSIATIPPVEVQVDGETIALTPVIQHPLPPGEHKVRLYDEEAWLDQVFPVTINKGQTTQEHFRFGKGQLEISGIPGIEIFIGSRRVGVTPLAPITLYTGTYIVRAKDETLNRDASFTTTVVGGKKIVLPVDLRGSWGQ